MNLQEAPAVDMAQYYETEFDARQEAKRPLHTLENGDIVVLKTNPHGDDIPAVFTAKVLDTPRESTKELMADGEAVMADIRFKRKNGDIHTFHCDNKYVHGHHSGLGRHSDIGRGLTAYDIDAFTETDETGEKRVCTDGGTDTGEDTGTDTDASETADTGPQDDERPEALPGYGDRPGKPPETIGTPTRGGKWEAWSNQNKLTTPEEAIICSSVRKRMVAMIDAKNGHDTGERFRKREYVRLAHALRRVRPSEQEVALWADSLEK